MKKRLIILSDLWGREKSDWLINYSRTLDAHFNIQFYDSCDLGQVDKSFYTKGKLHDQFVNGGIERAVEKLLVLETQAANILAFSIGGVIAWKYGIKSEKIESLFCLSSTRLRHETVRPKGKIALSFGSKDVYMPQSEWFENMQIVCEVFDDEDHMFYSNRNVGELISKRIIENEKSTIL